VAGVAVSCPTQGLCVAIAEGGIYVTNNPTGNPATWIAAGSPLPVGAADGDAVSCAGTKLCVAVDHVGNAFVSTDPTDGQSSVWTEAKIDPQPIWLASVSCPSTLLCVAVDQDGREMTTTNPTAASPSWSPPTSIDPDGMLTAVSCASNTFCAAVDSAGNVVWSLDPQAATPTWTAPLKIDSSVLTALSCSGDNCYAADDDGNVIVGSLTQPAGAIVVQASRTTISFGGPQPKLACTYVGSTGTPATPAVAKTTYVPGRPAGSYVTTCSGAKSPGHVFSYASGVITVKTAKSSVKYAGARTLKIGQRAHLVGTLTTPSGGAIVGRRIVLTVGTGKQAQSCTALTEAKGRGSCVIAMVLVKKGNDPVKVSFSGDASGPGYDYAAAQVRATVKVS